MELIGLEKIFDVISPPLIKKVSINFENESFENLSEKYYPAIFSLNRNGEVFFSDNETDNDISIVENYRQGNINSKYFLLNGDILINRAILKNERNLIYFYDENEVFKENLFFEKENLNNLSKFIITNRDKILPSHNFVLLRLKDRISISDIAEEDIIFENKSEKFEFALKIFSILKMFFIKEKNTTYSKNFIENIKLNVNIFKNSKLDLYVEILNEFENEKKYLERYIRYKELYISNLLEKVGDNDEI